MKYFDYLLGFHCICHDWQFLAILDGGLAKISNPQSGNPAWHPHF